MSIAAIEIWAVAVKAPPQNSQTSEAKLTAKRIVRTPLRLIISKPIYRHFVDRHLDFRAFVPAEDFYRIFQIRK
jgi:hypothetical protein